MSRTIRSTRGTGYPALMMFGIAYLSVLAVVLSPQAVLRITDAREAGEDGFSMTSPAGVTALVSEVRLTIKGDAEVLLP